MILRPEQIRLLRLGCPAIPANGGDSDSQANTTSNTTNTNFVTTEDRRVVASDAAIALSGNGNVASRTESTTFTDNSDNSTSFTDYSNRSVTNNDSSNRSTTFTDTSDRSTSFVDSSDRSTHITNTSTDFGSVQTALQSVTTMGTAALDVSDNSVQGAIDVLKQASDNSLSAVMAAFEAAAGTAADSVQMANNAFSFARQTTQMTNDAFARSEFGPDPENQKIMMLAAIAVAGAIGVAAILRK